MSEAVVAKRYAEALFQLAKEKGSIAEVQEQLTVVKEVLNENAQFVEVIQTPSISQDRKLQAIDETFKSAHPFVLNRSEERRVGKEWSSRRASVHYRHDQLIQV